MDEDQEIPDDTNPVSSDETLPGAPEDKRAEMEAAHDEALDVLPIDPPIEAAPDIQAQHDAIMSEIPDMEAPRDVANPLDIDPESLDDEAGPTPPTSRAKNYGQSPPEKQKKYYVPPSERTPANREQRRAEHNRILNSQDGGGEDDGQKYNDFLDAGGADDDPGQEGGVQQFAQSVVSHADRSWRDFSGQSRNLPRLPPYRRRSKARPRRVRNSILASHAQTHRDAAHAH